MTLMDQVITHSASVLIVAVSVTKLLSALITAVEKDEE